MADLQCLICEYVPPEDELPQDEMLVLIGAGSSTERGRALLQHMSEHTLSDWVKAFKMADTYIAQLEAELALERATVAGLRTDLSRAHMNRPSYAGETAGYGGAGIPLNVTFEAPANGDEPLAPNGQPLSRYLTPAEIERKRQQAEVRRQVEQADPDESLIPFIAPATRAEGVVGRKM